MNQRVFVVFAGEYSGRHIDAVFDSRALAEAWMNQMNEQFNETYDIQVYVVNKWAHVIEEGKATTNHVSEES